MREELKMALTLLIIGAISGALLTSFNSFTQPLIEAREKSEFMQALEEFFPEVESYEEKGEEGEKYFTAFDEDEEKLGIIARSEAEGYGEEPIRYEIAIDTEGEIIGTRVISHAETPGVGDAIESEDFKEQLAGLTLEDPISVGNDIEAVTGATVSVTSLVSSVRSSVDYVGEEFLDKEIETYESIDPSVVGSGTVAGLGTGFKGEIEVEVTVEDDEITDIELVSYEDTPDLVEKAEEELAEKIVANQSLDVDTVSGATATSEGIIEAVHEALD